MADDLTPGTEDSEPTPGPDLPTSEPPTPSPWAPAPPPSAPPPQTGRPAPGAYWENPAPDAWENPLAQDPPEPPDWQMAATVPAWGEPALRPASPPNGSRGLRGAGRQVVLAAAVGAVVGAVVAALVVVAVKDDGKTVAVGRPAVYSPNTSKIPRTGDVQEILSKVEPAVVSIRTRTLSLGDLLRPVPGQGAGTGFVIGSDGVIVTNNHVVAGAQSIEVVFADERKMPARVLGRDPATDLAVLKVDAAGLATAVLGDSDTLKVGDDVIAIGNALALDGGPTVTRGIVSAENRTITAENNTRLEHVIQTDTAINPGNSGGPLVNSAGEVVGINTAVAGDAQNIGFSIAITPSKPIIEELRTGTTHTRPFLGVGMMDVTPSVADYDGLKVDSGALVREVTPGSGAEAGGLRPGDVITAIDGKEIKTAGEVTSAIGAHKPGDEIKVTYHRGDESKDATVKLGERAADTG